MVYSNNDSFYFPPAAPEEFDSYPFLWGETSATPEKAYHQTTLTFASGWDTVDPPEPSAIPPTSLLPTGNDEKSSTLFIDPCLTRKLSESGFPTLSLCPSPPQASCWSTINQTTQDHPVMQSQANSFTSSPGWETAMPTQAPSPSKHHLDFQNFAI